MRDTTRLISTTKPGIILDVHSLAGVLGRYNSLSANRT
jgi:hypothetical protein